MGNKFSFNKKTIGFGIIGGIMFNIISIWLIIKPEIFIRNFLMKVEHIQIIGLLIFLYSLLMLYSFIVLLFRKKEAFIISDCYLIDNSRYESVGKIYFNEISKVKRIKKNSLEIVLKKPIFESKKLNFVQKILLKAHNWNPGNSIIVSSAMLNCDVEVLENTIKLALKRYQTT